jgi:glycosyltransferase involved in cell wall biosynthesis
LKIIFIHLLNDFSGSPKVLSQIVKNYKNKNHDVELFTSKDEGFLSNIVDKHHNFFYKRFENKFLTLFSYTLSQFHLFFKILFSKSDIVYINTLLPFGAALGAKISGKEVIYHIHETSIRPNILKKFLRYIVSNTASKIIFVSNDLEQKEKFENKKSFVIHNALENSFLKIASKYTYSHKHENKFIVMMICSLKDYKGIPEFLKIAKKLESHEHISFRLILNSEQNEIDKYFQNQKFENIEIFSKQKDLEKFYSTSSLVLNLSRVDQWVETFGLTIVEALAFGIPVIVPPIGGPIEIVEEDKEGFLISSYDVDKVAKKIEELANDEKLCMNLSSNARKKALDFSEDIFLENISKVIVA